MRKECGADYARVSFLLRGLDHYHPTTPGHYYIFLIAVKYSHRRKGVATGLLEELNTLLNSNRAACYAECTTPATQALFKRLGYRTYRQPIHIEGFPDLLPVWREHQ
ncbi:GNAT family N-acetyltransferase [Erwinia sp. V71]|uniref:GNAT family N-acetyltransferase n=1 Tax=Erwinia sp. V71 TaxID=3369424 RepID=UPI003F62722D